MTRTVLSDPRAFTLLAAATGLWAWAAARRPRWWPQHPTVLLDRAARAWLAHRDRAQLRNLARGAER